MSWNDDPNYTPQFKWRDLVWVALYFAGFLALLGACNQ